MWKNAMKSGRLGLPQTFQFRRSSDPMIFLFPQICCYNRPVCEQRKLTMLCQVLKWSILAWQSFRVGKWLDFFVLNWKIHMSQYSSVPFSTTFLFHFLKEANAIVDESVTGSVWARSHEPTILNVCIHVFLPFPTIPAHPIDTSNDSHPLTLIYSLLSINTHSLILILYLCCAALLPLPYMYMSWS